MATQFTGPTVGEFFAGLQNIGYGQPTGTQGEGVGTYNTFGQIFGNDYSKYLDQTSPFIGGGQRNIGDHLRHVSEGQVTDPLNQMDFRLPEPLKGSLFSDMGAWLPILAATGMMFATGGIGGAAGGMLGGTGATTAEAALAMGAGLEGLGGAGLAELAAGSGITDAALGELGINTALGGGTGASGWGFGSPEALLPNIGESAVSNVAQEVLKKGDKVSKGFFGDILDKLLTPDGLTAAGRIATGIIGTSTGRDVEKTAAQDALRLDPAKPIRDVAQPELIKLMNDPSSIVSRPGFDAGRIAVERSLAAMGYLPATQKIGGNYLSKMGDYAGNFYDKEMQRLMAMSQIQVPPSGGAILSQGVRDSTGMSGAALQNIIAGLAGLLKT